MLYFLSAGVLFPLLHCCHLVYSIVIDLRVPVEMSLNAAAMKTEPVQAAHSSDRANSLDRVESFDEKQNSEDDDVALGNLVYDHDEEEPELRMRTYIALAAMFLLNYVGIIALQGPPSVVSKDQQRELSHLD